MKRICRILLIVLMLFSCAPVLQQELMSRGSTTVPLSRMKETPAFYKGKLYIFGGLIVKTRNTDIGASIA